MKQFIPIFSLAVIMTACASNPNAGTATQVQQAPAYNADTVGLAQFQQWKAANELAAIKAYNAPEAQYTAPVKKARKSYAAPVSRRTSEASTNTTSPLPSTSEEGTMSSESSNTAKAPEKRGWSKAAKGSAIGAGTGAAAGAVLNKKNRVVGGVIGGVIGGAVGYGVGRHMDKRDGRY
jgi:hypothetical protein